MKGTKKLKRALPVLLFLIFCFLPAFVFSGNTAQQIVNFQIQEIGEIYVSGDPGPLIIQSLDPSYPNSEYDTIPDEDSSTYYNITTNYAFKITGELLQNMPQGTWIYIKLAEPPEGYSLGFVVLNDNYGTKLPAQTLLTSDPTSTTNLTITYKFAADLYAGTVNGNNTVKLTVLDLI
jgi:hypothetical protein